MSESNVTRLPMSIEQQREVLEAFLDDACRVTLDERIDQVCAEVRHEVWAARTAAEWAVREGWRYYRMLRALN